MKKVIIILLVTLVGLSYTNLSAQSFKFGHINSNELLKVVPEVDSVQKQMEAYAKDLELVIEEMQVEYNKKYDAWQKNEATWTEAIKTAKQKELGEIGRKVQEQMTNARTDYDNESQKRMAPVIEKVRAAITKVGKDNGFTYIFDMSMGAISFVNESQSINIMDLVKKELKITK